MVIKKNVLVGISVGDNWYDETGRQHLFFAYHKKIYFKKICYAERKVMSKNKKFNLTPPFPIQHSFGLQTPIFNVYNCISHRAPSRFNDIPGKNARFHTTTHNTQKTFLSIDRNMEKLYTRMLALYIICYLHICPIVQ